MTLDFSPALAIAILAAILPFNGGKAPAAEPKISEEEVKKAVFSLTDEYLRQFQHPEKGVLQGARLSGKDRWTSPEDVLAEKPKPWGYGSRIADTVLHTGHLLVAFLDAYEAGARQAQPDPTPAFSENNYPERIESSNGLIAIQDRTLATIRGGYRLLDLSATIGGPEAILIEGLKSRHHLGVPSIAGNRLYAANRAYGVISVIDISDLRKPVIEKEIPSLGNPCRIAVKNGIAFVPNGYEGLLLL